MTVNRIGSNINPLSDYPNKGKDTHVRTKDANDKILISKEGKIKSLESAGIDKLEQVKLRVTEGYYNQDKVISKVADAILKELKIK